MIELSTDTALAIAIGLLSVALTAQGVFTVYLMLYTWEHPERLAASRSPGEFAPPRLSFTAIIPARHEEAVIAQTIRRVWSANYPKELLEVVIVCEHSDEGTIAEARRAIRDIGSSQIWVETFDDLPINKPHGLNVAFKASSAEVVTIFDAEDDVHPDVFLIANTILERDGAAIVQAGVQLMDVQSSWYAVHNCLEYFFWFKSRLHFHARIGMVPLGGNTVFIRRELIDRAGGWDEACLTEDADIGIRLSVLGEKIAITYDAEHVTREETPPSLSHFIRQRTRWNQGFLQVLRKGDWLRMPSFGQRLLGGYVLTYPFVAAGLGLLWPLSIAMILWVKVPVPLAMLSFLPLYALVFQLVVNLAGLFEFGHVYRIRIGVLDVVRFLLGFLPYQGLLSLGAIRAVYRELRRQNNWEKTAHIGAHRGTTSVIDGRDPAVLVGAQRSASRWSGPDRLDTIPGRRRDEVRHDLA